MNKMQEQVREFNIAMNTQRGETPELRAQALHSKLIMEEASEAVAGILAGDLVKTIDVLCDVLYVVFGAADAFGIDIEPFFNEVHRTNMLKSTGPVREDGKRLKPEGWQPPRIAEMLASLQAGPRDSATKPMKAGDVVFHRPSGERWMLAYCDGDRLSACGWPESIAQAADCDLVTSCSPEKHREMLETWASKQTLDGQGDHRVGVCDRQLKALIARRYCGY